MSSRRSGSLATTLSVQPMFLLYEPTILPSLASIVAPGSRSNPPNEKRAVLADAPGITYQTRALGIRNVKKVSEFQHLQSTSPDNKDKYNTFHTLWHIYTLRQTHRERERYIPVRLYKYTHTVTLSYTHDTANVNTTRGLLPDCWKARGSGLSPGCSPQLEEGLEDQTIHFGMLHACGSCACRILPLHEGMEVKHTSA